MRTLLLKRVSIGVLTALFLFALPLSAQITATSRIGWKDNDLIVSDIRVNGDATIVGNLTVDSLLVDITATGDIVSLGDSAALASGSLIINSTGDVKIDNGGLIGLDSVSSVLYTVGGVSLLDVISDTARVAARDTILYYEEMQTGLTDATVDVKHEYNGPWAKAGENLVFGDVVYLAADSAWMKADKDTVGAGTFYPAWGFVTASISNGNTGAIMRHGTAFKSSWTWTPGGILYLSDAGAMTQSPDTSAGHVVQILGFALHPDLIEFDPDPTWARK